MRMVDIIQKKRDGFALNKEEIYSLIKGFTAGEIPDYQMAAFLMTVYYKGMSIEEITQLTMAMAHSGDIMDLSDIQGIKVDKHSTGGVGDKTTLVAAPLAAAAGVPVAKMSGRGLGYTGGTIDKLEAITGFNVELPQAAFIEQVNRCKFALVSQTGDLAYADKKIYALRDVTATVNSMPLIASSIMSKKIASAADAIVLDVKTGSGAFMKNLAEARELAEIMVGIGKGLKIRTIAVITDMNQPLGYEIGNANEVKEAIEVLQGKGEADFTKLCLTIAAYMVVAGEIYENFDQAYQALEKMLASGQAHAKFKEFITAQGGDPTIAEQPELLPQAVNHTLLKSDSAGYVQAIDAEKAGLAAMMLGAGRQNKNESIDYTAGITLHKKIGDSVQTEETLAELHSSREITKENCQVLRDSFVIGKQKPEKPMIVYACIE